MYASARKTQLYDMNTKRNSLIPHINSVSKTVYSNLNINSCQQAVLFLGKSGSGKSANVKHFVDYLLFINNSKVKQEFRYILDELFESANIVMESFCNTSTLSNNESSRCIKHIEIAYDTSYMISTFKFDAFIFDLHRVVENNKTRGNFSIFYQLVDAEQKVSNKSLGLEKIPTKSGKLAKTGKPDPESQTEDLSKSFSNTCESLNAVGIDYEQQSEIFQILASIMHISKISISEQDRDASSIKDDDSFLGLVSDLLKIDKNDFVKCLTKKVLVVGSTKITRNLNTTKAKELKDSLCKYLYSATFKWVLQKINKSFADLSANHKQSDIAAADPSLCKKLSINTLDICGYSNEKINSFEEFCINYANEKLFNYYIHNQFFKENGAFTKGNAFPAGSIMLDNEGCIRLIEGEHGIISTLGHEMQNQTKDDAQMVEELFQSLNKPDLKMKTYLESKKRVPAFSFLAKSKFRKNEFVIKHYFEDTVYTIDDFTSRNREGIAKNLHSLFSGCGLGVLKSIISLNNIDSEASSKGKNSDTEHKTAQPANQAPGKKKSIQTTATVSGDLKCYLEKKIKVLKSSKTSYVFCIAPNQSKRGIEFSNKAVLDQIKSLKLVEISHIHNNVFDNQMKKSDFITQYRYITDYFPDSSTQDQIIKQIMSEAKIDGYYYNLNGDIVFYKTHAKRLLEAFKKAKIEIESKKVVKRKHKINRKPNYPTDENVIIKVQKLIRVVLKKKYELEEQKQVAARCIQHLARSFLSKKLLLELLASPERDRETKFYGIEQICHTVNIMDKADLTSKLQSYLECKQIKSKKLVLFKIKEKYLRKQLKKATNAKKPTKPSKHSEDEYSEAISSIEKRLSLIDKLVKRQTTQVESLNSYTDGLEKLKSEMQDSSTADGKLSVELKKTVDQIISENKTKFTEHREKLDSAIAFMQQENNFVFERLTSLQQYASKAQYDNTMNKQFLKCNIDIQNTKLNEIINRLEVLESRMAKNEPNYSRPVHKISLAKKISTSSSDNSGNGLQDIPLPSFITIKRGRKKLTPFVADNKKALNSILHESFQQVIQTNIKKSSSSESNIYSGIKEMQQDHHSVSDTKESSIQENKPKAEAGSEAQLSVQRTLVKTNSLLQDKQQDYKNKLFDNDLRKSSDREEHKSLNQEEGYKRQENSLSNKKPSYGQDRGDLDVNFLKFNTETLQSYKAALEGLDDASIFDKEYQRQSRIIYAESIMFGGNFINCSEIEQNDSDKDQATFAKVAVENIRKTSTLLNVDQQYIKSFSAYTKPSVGSFRANSAGGEIEEMLKSKKISRELSDLVKNTRLPRVAAEINYNKLTLPSNLFGLVVVKMMNYSLTDEVAKAVQCYTAQVKAKIISAETIHSLLFWAKNTQEVLGILKAGFKVNQERFKGYTTAKKTRSVCTNTLKKLLLAIHVMVSSIITKELKREVLFTIPAFKHKSVSPLNTLNEITEPSSPTSVPPRRADVIISFLDQVLPELNKYELSRDFVDKLITKVLKYMMIQTFNTVLASRELCTLGVTTDICQNIAALEIWCQKNKLSDLKTDSCAPKQAFKLLQVLTSEYKSMGVPPEAFAKEYTLLSYLQLEVLVDSAAKNASSLNSDLNELLIHFQSSNSQGSNEQSTSIFIDPDTAINEKTSFSTKEVGILNISTPEYLGMKLLKFIISAELNQLDDKHSNGEDSEFDFEYGGRSHGLPSAF